MVCVETRILVKWYIRKEYPVQESVCLLWWVSMWERPPHHKKQQSIVSRIKLKITWYVPFHIHIIHKTWTHDACVLYKEIYIVLALALKKISIWNSKSSPSPAKCKVKWKKREEEREMEWNSEGFWYIVVFVFTFYYTVGRRKVINTFFSCCYCNSCISGSSLFSYSAFFNTNRCILSILRNSLSTLPTTLNVLSWLYNKQTEGKTRRREKWVNLETLLLLYPCKIV